MAKAVGSDEDTEEDPEVEEVISEPEFDPTSAAPPDAKTKRKLKPKSASSASRKSKLDAPSPSRLECFETAASIHGLPARTASSDHFDAASVASGGLGDRQTPRTSSSIATNLSTKAW